MASMLNLKLNDCNLIIPAILAAIKNEIISIKQRSSMNKDNFYLLFLIMKIMDISYLNNYLKIQASNSLKMLLFCFK